MVLTDWEAVPLAGPLAGVADARTITRAWNRVEIPGHWQLESAFSAYDGLVLYRCRFPAQHSSSEFSAVFLRLDGVYYSARVWLNGVFLGGHEGYFSPFEFDVTDALAEENELLVEVFSPAEPDENDRSTIGGAWAGWDGMATHFNPGGIFRNVSLVRSGALHIRQLEVTADHRGNGRAMVEVYARHGLQALLEGQILPVGFDAPGTTLRKEVWAEPGINHFEVKFRLPSVRAWWTWDRGEQSLYELTLECGEGKEKVCFGARTIELRDWNVYLNGERLFLRGINCLPTDVYPARASYEQLRTDVSLVREAGMNALRIHAHIAEPGFYEACDEMGILIFQDFPLQWTHRRRVLQTAVNQASEMARDLQSHPSVAVYLAHDEPFFVAPPEKWSFFALLRTTAEVLSPRWLLWQRRVLGPAVMRAIAEEDGSRPVIDAAGHPLTTNHLYFGWYYGRFRDLERALKLFPGLSRLPTEYGVQALPDEESLKEIWPAEEPPNWEVLSRDYRLQVQRMMRYVPWRGDRARFIRESQRYQAEALKHATELFRRRKYWPAGGTFAFMLNDAAPAITWSVVDWRRRPKAAYKVLKTAMAPVLICVEYPKEAYKAGAEISLPLFVVNDLAQAPGWMDWSWELCIGETRFACGGGRTEVPADSVVSIGRVRARLPVSGPALLRLYLRGKDVSTSNEYGFEVG